MFAGIRVVCVARESFRITPHNRIVEGVRIGIEIISRNANRILTDEPAPAGIIVPRPVVIEAGAVILPPGEAEGIGAWCPANPRATNGLGLVGRDNPDAPRNLLRLALWLRRRFLPLRHH